MAQIQRNIHPKNPDHDRKIREMFHPSKLLSNMAYYNEELPERSIEYCLEDTDDFREWANKKKKGTNLDPENRKPIQISNSPLSDYDIEFTHFNGSDGTTPSSLSSLSIPVTSMSFHDSSTPRTSKQNRKTKSLTAHRRSGPLTPTQILHQRQSELINKAIPLSRLPRISFNPITSSTPVRLNPMRKISFQRECIQQPQRSTGLVSIVNTSNKSAVVSSDDENQIRSSKNKNTLNVNESSDRTLTNTNRENESSATIVPETQENDSIVPETQRNDSIVPETQKNDSIIPETQRNDSIVPETQKNNSIVPETQDNEEPDTQNDYVPETQDAYIPETQEENIPTTQNEVTSNPVQAQVSNDKEKHQAEPQNVSHMNTRSRINARPPLRNPSHEITPSKYVPLDQVKTPSRIPIVARTPVAVASTIPQPVVPNIENNLPKISEANLTNASNVAGRTVVIVTSPRSKQSLQSSETPATGIPATNMTVNVNVNGPMPQSPVSTTQTIDTNQPNIDNPQTNVTKSKNGHSMSSNNSKITNDSDSEMSLLETPRNKTNLNNTSAKRQLNFSTNSNNDRMRCSETYDKIDNMTRTIRNGDSIASNLELSHPRTRAINKTIQHVKSPQCTVTLRSQTFSKSGVSIPQDATYDISAASENYMKDIPSEAILDPIELTDDSSHGNNMSIDKTRAHIGNGSSDRSDLDASKSAHNNRANSNRTKSHNNKTTTQYNPNSQSMNPILCISRIDESMMQRKNATNIFGKSGRESLFQNLTPPSLFQDTCTGNQLGNGTLDQFSPKTGERRLSELISSYIRKQSEKMAKPTEPPKRKRSSRKKNQAAAEIEKLEVNQLPKNTSGVRKSRRLRSHAELHPNDTIEFITNPEQSPNSTTSAAAAAAAAVAAAVTTTPTRKSSDRTSHNANNIDEDADGDDVQINVNLELEPIDVDEPVGHDMNVSTESLTPLPGFSPLPSREPSPVPDTKSKQSRTAKQSIANNKSNESEAKNDNEIENKTKNNMRVGRPRQSNASTKSKTAPKKSTVAENKSTKSKKVDENSTVGCDNNNNGRPKRVSSIESDWYRDLRTTMFVNALGKPKTSTKPVQRVRISEDEPPSKKRKTVTTHESTVRESEAAHKPLARESTRSTKPSAIRASKQLTMPTKSLKNTSVSETNEMENSNIDILKAFLNGEDGKKRLHKLQYWKDLADPTKKNCVTQEDGMHINTVEGTIETLYTDQIEFDEIEGVYYGLMPSKNYHCGFMRFPPGSKKRRGKSSSQLSLFILRGTFTVSNDSGLIEVFGSTELTIMKNEIYEINNIGENVGVIQFIYT